MNITNRVEHKQILANHKFGRGGLIQLLNDFLNIQISELSFICY